MKSLVVYYTRTGNAKFVAETVATQLGADIEEIIDQKKYGGPIGWVNAGKNATQEKEAEINSTKYNPADYDLVVIGTPVWAWRPTPAIRTYTKKDELKGKKAALILNCDGDPKQAVERTKALIPNSTVVSTLVLKQPLKNKEETEKQITNWCNTLR